MSNINAVRLNQDKTMFSLSLDEGFIIYEIDPFQEQKRQKFKEGGLCITEMLYRTNLIGLVGGGTKPAFKPNKAIIWDDKEGKVKVELEFRSVVKQLRLSMNYIVVALAFKVFVYTLSPKPEYVCSFETSSNDKGILELASLDKETGSVIICFPGVDPSHLQIVDVSPQSSYQSWIIAAHQSSIYKVCFNMTGRLVATCSEKGTLIRVFDTLSGRILKEFRRGIEKAEIWTLCFSKDSTKLAVASDRGTIHIFSCSAEEKSSPNVLEILKDFLPKYFSSQWSHSFCYISSKIPCECFFEEGVNCFYVLVTDGTLLHYEFDPEVGGECRELFKKIII